MMPLIDITGQRLGRLVAQKREAGLWVCLCDCGNVVRRNGTVLRSGDCASCGCLQRETAARIGRASARHRACKTPEYLAWTMMIKRCTNEKCDAYPNYGGRGIRVSLDWSGRGGFEAFLAHVGPRPSPRHSVDRIDVNRDYEPGNVRWSTPEVQQRNRRNNHLVEVDGEKMTLTEACERSGIRFHTAKDRLARGWSVKDALTVPVRPLRVPALPSVEAADARA